MAAAAIEQSEAAAPNDAGTAAGYGSFTEQIRALQAAAAPSPGAMATPALAQAWAGALIAYWQAGVESGRIDSTLPFYVLDLVPVEGRFAWLLLTALRNSLSGSQRKWPLRLLACCADTAEGAALLAHPYVAQFVENGWLDAATFDAQHAASLTLHQQGINLMHTDNPLVILGLDYFHTLPCELFGMHYGELLEGQLAIATEPGQTGAIQLDYQWLAASAAGHGAAALLDYYLARCHHAAIMLPTSALHVLRSLQKIGGGRYLLLAAGHGVHDEKSVRMGGMAPPSCWDGNRLPVNFHALSLAQSRCGAAVANLAADDDDTALLLHLAWRDDRDGPDIDCFERLRAQLGAAHPADGAALQQLAAGLVASVGDTDHIHADGAPGAAGATMLALLRLSQHDPAVFKLLCPAVLRLIPTMTESTRYAWRLALAATWDHFMPLRVCDDFHVDCALLAMQLGYWGLAQDSLRTALGMYGEDAHDLYLLAWCESNTGASASALQCLQRALALNPAHAGAQTLLDNLRARMDAWGDCPWYQPELAGDAELRLEPLGLEHAADLFYQYREDQIGIMTRLPDFCSVEQVERWIAEQAQEAGRVSYAVMHACWGMVGVVSAHCAETAAYFYYWIGCDHQQRGYGQRAARLLFQQLTAFGVTAVYTSVDQVNQHSRHVLRKLGFEQLALRAAPPDDGQDFYYLGEAVDHRLVRAGFFQLCAALGSPIQAEEI